MDRDIDNILYAIWLAKEVRDLTKNLTIHIKESDIKKLPASCFLWIGDRENRKKWFLPYRSGNGEFVNGVYESAGSVSIPILKAVSMASAKEYIGAPTAPHQIKGKIKKLLKQYNISEYQGGKMKNRQKFSMTEASLTGR